MNNRSDHLLDRVGAAAGIATVTLLVALLTAFPSLPGPDSSIGEIARDASTNRDGLLLGAYAGALMTGTLLLFGACFATRLRHAEGRAGGWSLVASVGIAGTVVGLGGNALEIMFVRAVGHGATGTDLWIGYGANHWFSTLTAIPLALFLFGAGAGARVTRTLPRWLAWLAGVLSVLFLAGAASVTGDELEGGVLGMPLVAGYVGLIVWIVATSITMLRPDRAPGAAPAAAAG